jgi:NADPH2:quinone reductase
MAKLNDARVIATVSSPAKAAIAVAAGADHTLDYKREDVVERIKTLTGGRGVDRVIEVDLAANIKWLPRVVADYGLIVVYGSGAREVPVSFGESIIGNIGYRFFIVYNQPPALRAEAVRDLTRLLQANSLTHAIGARFPLDRIVEAHEAVESGKTTGNVVVTIA